MHRLAHLILLLCLPLLAAGQGCGVKVKPGDHQTYSEALTLYDGHRYREAAKLMRRVAQRNPKAAEPQFWLGMMSVANGFNTTGIRKYFTKCIELCPNYPNALAHYYMGMIYYTDERYEEAQAEMEYYFRLANYCDDPAQTAVYEEASAYLHWSRFLAEANLNRVPFDPQPLARVSSRQNENLPYITPDGSRCYYLREVPLKKDNSSFYQKVLDNTRWALCYSTLQDTANDQHMLFDSGIELPAPFNQGNPEGSVSTTADGKTLFFSRITRERNYANCDIYCAKMVNGKWKEERLGPNINGEKSWESQPSVTPDGQWLYFASNRKGGQGGTDIWRCHRLNNGDWSRAENLGPAVNTLGNEKSPFIHADGHTLYFVSDGWQGFGGYDIYFINLAEGGEARPTNLGLPINSEDDELSFGVTADGTQAYFPGRVVASRSKDILIFDLYPAARPEPMRCCHATVATATSRRDTVLMLSQRNPTAVTFAVEGLMPQILCLKGTSDCGTVTLADSLSPLHIKPLSGSRLSERDERLLDAWADWLLAHPRVHVAIECPRQPDAKAVYDYLCLKRKLRPERLECRGGSQFSTNQIRLL
jgi:Tol biopolymer transport system component